MSYFDRNQAGDIISRVSYDVDVVTMSISADLVQILTSIVTVVGSFVMMCIISPQMTICVFITVPISIYFTRWMGKRTRPLYSKRSAAYGEMNGYVEEMFSGQKTILAYAYEDDVCQDFSAINRKAAEAYRDADTLGTRTGPTINMINNLGLSIVGIVGSAFYVLGMVGLEQISSFVLYSRKFSGPINEVANIINELYSALAAAERIFTLLDEPEETADLPDALTLQDAKGDVEARHVAFGYVPGRIVLHDLSLHAKPGQTFAIVGHTGAGKTTIINLLMRFYDVNSGEIFVDGHEIRRLTRDSLRRAYAMVLQDTWVFQGTIYENIAYGKEGASHGGGRRRREGRAHPPLYHAIAAGLQHRHQRGRRQHQQGAEAAAHDRPRHALQHADAYPRRGDEQCGHEHGTRGAARHAGAHEGQDVLRHRPPPLHHPARGQHPRDGPRRGGGAGHARRAHAEARRILQAVCRPVRMTGGEGGKPEWTL